MITLVLILVIVACLDRLNKIKYSHWSKRGVKGPKPLPFVGNFGRLMMQKQSISELGEAAYNQFPEEKVVGLYCGFTPVLLLRDPEVISQVMTTDFNNFVNRGARTSDKGFSDNLLIAEDDVWRNLRKKLSPAFTSTKLKQMIPFIQDSVSKFIRHVEISVDAEGNCDIKDFAGKYAMDLVCSSGFGLKLDFYSGKTNELTELGKEAITPSPYFRLWYAAEMLIPGIQKMIPVVDPVAHLRAFFIKLVTEVIGERKKMKEKRHDFMEILIKLLEQDQIKSNDRKEISQNNVDINFISAQAFIFYSTGFETSASTLSYILYELSLHEDCQEKVYREICTVLDKYDGELTYDSLNEMTYLQKVLNETLRKNCLVGWVIRKASKDYMLPGTGINVRAGTFILVSVAGLHSDPKYFEDPETFNPENFSREKVKQTPQCVYIPFGTGPRNCIGLRFAKQHVMMAVVTFLRKFKVNPCTDKQKKIKFDSISLTLNAVDGIWINISQRNQTNS